MRHLDLFSGIGGASLAAEMVWDGVEHIFCEIDPFCQAVLRKHWPNSLIYGDIKQLTADSIYEGLERQAQGVEGREEHLGHNGDSVRAGLEPGRRGVDLLTGGFPCQPFSSAGRRRGTEDDRHLWPEMLRVIRETNPRWVVGENVGGLLTWNGGMVLDEVFADLEGAGYEVGAFVIPACAVQAPHRRDRVWIVAHTVSGDARGAPRAIQGAESEERIPERDHMAESGQSGSPRVPSDTEHARLDGSEDGEGGIARGNSDEAGTHENEQPSRSAVSRHVASNARSERRQQITRSASGDESQDEGRPEEDHYELASHGQSAWREDWPSVAARLCTLDDGLPDGLARPKGWRNAALKGAGNAWVPQVAAEIFRGIKEIDAH